ncbi:MAG: hypothetical protein OEV43_10295, partial [Coriobacteriia bacterium]|nr:hypothetical protein [Coriobacteriia bacterium]
MKNRGFYRAMLATLVVSAMVFTLVLPAAANDGNGEPCGPCGTPQVSTLYAGQDMDVGTVTVMNCEDKLCVLYELNEDAIAEGWLIVETHTHAADELADIPQKNGNPIPGQFEKQSHHDPGVTEYKVCFDLADLGLSAGEMAYVAAHAVIEKPEEFTCMPELTWMRSEEPTATLDFPGYGTQWTKEQAFAIPLDPEQVVWDNGAYYNPGGVTPGVNWASWKYRSTDPDGGSYNGFSDLRRFRATFNLPTGATVTGGELRAKASHVAGIPINDNLYVFLNEELEFWGGTRVYTGQVPGTFMGVAGVSAARGTVEPRETDRWYIPGTFPDISGFVSGANAVDVFTEENERWGGMGELELELDCVRYLDETAWGDGEDFPGRNWATYIKYEIQPCEIQEVWPEGGTMSVAYEDLPLAAGNDWDYNDFVADISTTATFTGLAYSELAEMSFTITPQAKMAGYTHVMHLAPDAFGCDGTYELYRDSVLVDSGVYDDSAGMDFVIVPNTGSLPIDAQLVITFDPGCMFEFPTWDDSLYHGENLFFDPYIFVNNNGQYVHTGDPRMLTVPVDWAWPTSDG